MAFTGAMEEVWVFFALSKILGFFLVPTNLFVLCVTFGLLLTATRLRRGGIKIASLGVSALLFFGFTSLGFLCLLPLENRFARAELADGADVEGILILGGAEEARIFEKRGVSATNESGERFLDAAALARRFPKARLVFSGGSGQLIRRSGDSAATARAILEALGIAPARIETEPMSRNTAENAAFSKAQIRPKSGERWLLVTSAWHMPRAIGCFRAVGWTVEPWPVDYQTDGTFDPFSVNAAVGDGLKRFDMATKEWIGLVVYYLTGRTDSFFPGPAPR